MSQIKWLTSLDEGLAQSRTENRLVFADFFNPG